MHGRIFFEGNPWPEGHPIKECQFSASLSDAGVSLNLHLVTEDYYSEREIIEYDENDNLLPEFEDLSAWQSPGCWYNYHACTISNTFWGSASQTTLVSKPGQRFSISDLSGRQLSINPVPTLTNGHADPTFTWEHDELNFHTYLLGHDAVADHNLTFTQTESGLFNIHWTGRIALAYVGETEFKYRFHADLKDVPFLGYACPRLVGESVSDHIYPPLDERRKVHRGLANTWLANVESLYYLEREERFEKEVFSHQNKRMKFWV